MTTSNPQGSGFSFALSSWFKFAISIAGTVASFYFILLFVFFFFFSLYFANVWHTSDPFIVLPLLSSSFSSTFPFPHITDSYFIIPLIHRSLKLLWDFLTWRAWKLHSLAFFRSYKFSGINYPGCKPLGIFVNGLLIGAFCGALDMCLVTKLCVSDEHIWEARSSHGWRWDRNWGKKALQ